MRVHPPLNSFQSDSLQLFLFSRKVGHEVTHKIEEHRAGGTKPEVFFTLSTKGSCIYEVKGCEKAVIIKGVLKTRQKLRNRWVTNPNGVRECFPKNLFLAFA